MITAREISRHNDERREAHDIQWSALSQHLAGRGLDAPGIVGRVAELQVAIPSWALGAGGTRFGRFTIGGEPVTLADKIDDIGLVHALTTSAGTVSLHIPWDVPADAAAVVRRAADYGLAFDAVNSNTFQDQPDQRLSYKFGSLCHSDASVRQQAIEHNIEVINIGERLGSKALTIWLADGTNFPGQHDFRSAYRNTEASLQAIYAALPPDWRLLIEYKPYEPNFYSMVIPDWGTSLSLAESCGPRAFTLVDLGHHLPNTNIEQIVALLSMKGRLGGFHFNDSKYGDDDLSVGSVKPYQLFLIFCELIGGEGPSSESLAWMIDASHNVKDPLEDLIQSLEAIRVAYAQALLVDRAALADAQQANDVVLAQELLQAAFRTDVRPLVAAARLHRGGALDPIALYRQAGVRRRLIANRGANAKASGL